MVVLASLGLALNLKVQRIVSNMETDDPEGATEKYLIATSEQPICGYHQNENEIRVRSG